MTYSRITGQYNKTQIETASGIDLVILCHEKTIQFFNQSKQHHLNGEIELKCKKLDKVIAIISELRSSLDYENGGQIAENLDAIYTYLINRIIEGDLNKDLEVYDEAIKTISELKSAWDEIASSEENEKPNISTPLNFTDKITAQVAA